jgi:ABC-type transport system involved in cytochrome c biogenesis permease subunit
MKMKKDAIINGILSVVVGILIFITVFGGILLYRHFNFDEGEGVAYIVAVMILCGSYVFAAILLKDKDNF